MLFFRHTNITNVSCCAAHCIHTWEWGERKYAAWEQSLQVVVLEDLIQLTGWNSNNHSLQPCCAEKHLTLRQKSHNRRRSPILSAMMKRNSIPLLFDQISLVLNRWCLWTEIWIKLLACVSRVSDTQLIWAQCLCVTLDAFYKLMFWHERQTGVNWSFI